METVCTRPSKYAVRLGDVTKVAPTELEVSGVKLKDRGWSNATVLRFLDRSGAVLHGQVSGDVLAEVTVPQRAATRTIDAHRLTRTRRKG